MFSIFNRSAGKSRGAILMYHQVGTLQSDTWQLAVSEKHFSEQLTVISKWKLVTVEKMVSLLKEGKMEDKTIAISFDDGYRSNFKLAFPLLKERELAASFYLTNFSRENDQYYWWDELEQLLLAKHPLPSTLSLRLNDWEKTWNFRETDPGKILDVKFLQSLSTWLPWTVPPTVAHAVFVWLCEFFKTLSFDKQQDLLEQIKAQIIVPDLTMNNYELMDNVELLTLVKSGMIEIGAHTSTHLALSHFPPKVQLEAIQSNKLLLEEKINKKVYGLAYPHGAHNQETINLAKDLGFDYALSTNEGLVHAKTALFQLPRIHVKDWSGNQFEKQLSDWFK